MSLGLPSKVKGCALLLLKRYMLCRGPLELDLKALMLTCLYLACKVEETYHSAETLGGAAQLSEKVLLSTELPLLQGLRFELVAFSPYRSCRAFADLLRGGGGLQP